MKREAKEKYAEISEAIEQAEKAEFDRILDDIASGSKKRLICIRNNESDIEMIYLRCRRIAIVLEYFRFRTPKQNAVLKKDCDDVIKMIAFNEYRLSQCFRGGGLRSCAVRRRHFGKGRCRRILETTSERQNSLRRKQRRHTGPAFEYLIVSFETGRRGARAPRDAVSG